MHNSARTYTQVFGGGLNFKPVEYTERKGELPRSSDDVLVTEAEQKL